MKAFRTVSSVTGRGGGGAYMESAIGQVLSAVKSSARTSTARPAVQSAGTPKRRLPSAVGAPMRPGPCEKTKKPRARAMMVPYMLVAAIRPSTTANGA